MTTGTRGASGAGWRLAAWMAGLVTLVLVGNARAASGTPDQIGKWGNVFSLPVTATHTTLLPNGKVMFFGEFFDGYNPYLFDPVAGTITPLAHPSYNIFCGGHALLPDGQLFVAGGHTAAHVGLQFATTYDPATNTWTRLPDMNDLRWYPSVITTATGEILVTGGEIAGAGSNDTLPQVFNPKTGTWRDLTTALRNIPYYSRMFQAPDGTVVATAPETGAYALDISGTGKWKKIAATVSPVRRAYGSGVMYLPGKVLIAGGGDPPLDSAETIDLTAPKPAWKSTAPMSIARRQQNATILPDGRVLVTGGTSNATFNDRSGGVQYGEVWDPATGKWTTWATADKYRGYHSGAVLLADGRVFSGGGTGNVDKTAQIFQPPYLFMGARPRIVGAPMRIVPGQSFQLVTPDAATITRVTLVRLGSVTHAWNMNQRFNELAFTASANDLTVTAPPSNNYAPPGHYMLFALNAAGVPSLAWILQLGFDGEPSSGSIAYRDITSTDPEYRDPDPAPEIDPGPDPDPNADPDATPTPNPAPSPAKVSKTTGRAAHVGCSTGLGAPALALAVLALLPLARRRERRAPRVSAD